MWLLPPDVGRMASSVVLLVAGCLFRALFSNLVVPRYCSLSFQLLFISFFFRFLLFK